MPADWFIGLDVGTSGCRAIAIDASDRVVATARCDLPSSSRPRPGWSEQRPADWWEAVASVLKAIAGRGGNPRSLCLDGTSSTLLLVDGEGAPLTAGLMYDDRRAAIEAEHIDRLAPADSPARGAGSAMSKLLYLLNQRTDSEATFALHQADWLTGRLTGRFGMADENNVLKLGYDPTAGAWPSWLEAMPAIRPLLPRVVPAGSALGRIQPAVAEQLDLPDDLLIVAGTTDSNAATLAADGHNPGDAVTSLGSTLVLKIWSDQPVNAARFGVYSHRLKNRWLAGGASNSGGAVLRQYFSDDELVTLSDQIDTSRPSELDYYPLPGVGERFPICDPDCAPRLTPVPQEKAKFLQGMLEGIARIEASGYRLLAELGAPLPKRVFTAGGGAANPVWREIREQMLGVPVVTAAHTEAAFGVAKLARSAWHNRE